MIAVKLPLLSKKAVSVSLLKEPFRVMAEVQVFVNGAVNDPSPKCRIAGGLAEPAGAASRTASAAKIAAVAPMMPRPSFIVPPYPPSPGTRNFFRVLATPTAECEEFLTKPHGVV